MKYYRLYVIAAPGTDLLGLRDEINKLSQLAKHGVDVWVNETGWPKSPWGKAVFSTDGRLLRHLERKLQKWRPDLEVTFTAFR